MVPSFSRFQDYDDLESMFRADQVGIPDGIDRDDVCFFCGINSDDAKARGLELKLCRHCQDVYRSAVTAAEHSVLLNCLIV